MPRWTVSRTIALGVGLFMLAFGIWALASPASFYEQIAMYPPYNRHLIHDIGAFQAGLGATLLFAFFRSDAAFVVLLGAAVGWVLHTIAHVMDRSIGGRATDPTTVGFVAALLVVAAILRSREIDRP